MLNGYVLSLHSSWHEIDDKEFRNILRINDQDKRMMAIVCPQMPDQLWNDLFDKIELIFPNHLKDTDTQVEGIENIFPTWIFEWWNWFSEQVHFHYYPYKKYSLLFTERWSTNPCRPFFHNFLSQKKNQYLSTNT